MTDPRTVETGPATGTKDRDYDLLWFVEKCLDNALRMDLYIADAQRTGDGAVEDLFRRAQKASRRGAEEGKALLAERLAGPR